MNVRFPKAKLGKARGGVWYDGRRDTTLISSPSAVLMLSSFLVGCLGTAILDSSSIIPLHPSAELES